jgi:hypothetical protein
LFAFLVHTSISAEQYSTRHWCQYSWRISPFGQLSNFINCVNQRNTALIDRFIKHIDYIKVNSRAGNRLIFWCFVKCWQIVTSY